MEDAIVIAGVDRSRRPLLIAVTALAGAMVAIGIVGALSSPSSWLRATRGEQQSVRTIEPRLSGAAEWAPFVPNGRSAGGPAIATQRGAASSERHRSGVFQLLAGHHRQALATLEAEAAASDSASAWNDLAAAYHEAAMRYDSPEWLASAVMACDRALARAPATPDALFNRALVLEHLGLRDEARLAWETYLRTDAETEWAAEARRRVATLAPATKFNDLLERAYDRVAGDPKAAADLVARDPFAARAQGVEVLGRWAEATQRGAAGEATRHLAVARALGSAVAAFNGEHLLERAVARIDGADPGARALLASAHARYREGMQARQQTRPGDAEPILRDAAARFESAGSPMVIPAKFFAASCAFDQGRHDEAEHTFQQLRLSIPGDSPAYRAFVIWQLGTCNARRGEWGAAVDLYEQSIRLFETTRETQNEAAVQRLLAFVYDRVGDSESAWRHRIAALRGLGGEPGLALEKTLASIADAAMLDGDWNTASSFLTLHIELSRRLGDDLQLGTTLAIRAVVRDRIGDRPGAVRDLEAAGVAAARVKDASYAALLRVARLRATALLRATPPPLAASLLTEAIDYHATKGDRMGLPGLLLLRARARRATGDRGGAMADLQQGMAELERQRESLPEGEARWGAFHAASELFDDAVDLALTEGDTEAAFAFAERARARALLDADSAPPAALPRRIPRGTTVVEYVSLPSRSVIFVIDAAGVRAVQRDVPRERLASEITRFVEALRSDAPDSAKAAAPVYRDLIEPVESELAGASTIVFAPDAVSASVPFGALTDAAGRYLVEKYAVAIAPSASAFAAAVERRRGVSRARTALVISSAGAADGQAALAFVDRETSDIERAYERATVVDKGDAQVEALRRRAADSDVIHFGGHAVGDERGLEPSSLILREGQAERRLRVGEIARLKLRPSSTVVLAGCNTARGKRRAAEGVVSVAYGFLSAGSSSVIATLWPIDDRASATFFPRVHRRLAEGVGPAAALREAQLESIRNHDIPPSLWAAVQDIGS